MKNHLLIVVLGAVLLLNACTTAAADADLKWHHKNNEGQAVNHVAEEVNNIRHTPQEAVDKINALYEGSVIEVELDKNDSDFYYEIEIVHGDVKYDSKVNADTLEIIKLEKGEADSEDKEGSVKRITPDAAFDIAADEVSGEVLSWELDDNEYKVIMEDEEKLVKVEIDALTEKILSVNVQNDERDTVEGSGAVGDEEESSKKEETKSDEEKSGKKDKASEKSSDQAADQQQESKTEENTQQENSSGLLTPQEAMNIALHAVGGIVIEWEYDEEDFEYEIELNANGQEVEVEIDSRNGAILDVDYD